MADLSISEERARLQSMRDNPQNDLERAFKVDVLDGGSQPHEWSDDTVRSCNTFWRIYEMGFNTARAAVPAQAGAAQTGVCVGCGETEPGTWMCSSKNPLALCNAAAQPPAQVGAEDAGRFADDEKFCILVHEYAKTIPTGSDVLLPMTVERVKRWNALTAYVDAAAQPPAQGEHSAGVGELSDERIDQLARKAGLDGSMVVGPRHDYWRAFARSVLAATAQGDGEHSGRVAKCKWTLTDEDNAIWESSCGEAWSFVDGGPEENRVSFCHHCGKSVDVAAAHKAQQEQP